MSDLKLHLLAVLLLGLAGFSSGIHAQELEDLLEEGEEEEAELRKIPGTDIPGIGDETIRERLRLPKGEEVERLRLSQDREIDSETYIVGPGDVIQLYIWGEFDLSYLLQVDPEGNILIPTVDIFHVSNQTLAAVKERILAAAQDKYPGVEITVTLSSMRYFTVYLTGTVLQEGSVIIHPITRVSDLIERGGGFLDDLRGTIEETVAGKKVTRARQFQPQPTARRSIQLIHRDGTRESVDLEMFKATGDVRFNPYLRMGDVVHVEYRQRDIFVYGSVNKEGVQEYRPGDTIAELVTLAGGMSGDAPLEEAEIWRFRPDGKTVDIIPLVKVGNPEKFVTLADISDFSLRPKDMFFVRTRSDWQQTPTVHVHGEVKYRGRYRIVAGETRLRDIVKQAGGFAENASLAQATLIRAKHRAIADPELQRLQALQRVSGLADMNPEDRAYLKTKYREVRGRVAVDFERLFRGDDESQNILLEGGDVIFVPEKRLTVSISGQLKRPGLIDFEEGRRVAYYLDKAGGYAWNADKGGARLIQARTGVREKLDKNLIVEAGDEIWIPEKEYRDWWEFTQSTMRTLAEALTLVVLVRTF